MRPKEIQELVRIVENSSIDELEVTKWGRKIRIRKHKVAAVTGSSVEYITPSSAVHSSAPAAPAPQPETEVTPAPSDNYVEIKAPMVGTFYRAPSPDSDPYVKEGDIISKGQVLCLIEAMKLMNEIEAEISGRIVKILIDNAQPIEYNQPLFLIDPS